MSDGGNGQRPARKQPGGRSCLVLVAVAALLAALAVLAGLAAQQSAAAPAVGLHSVWCVKRGYPADLALPVVVGPGTGLSGCPAGEVQVKP